MHAPKATQEQAGRTASAAHGAPATAVGRGGRRVAGRQEATRPQVPGLTITATQASQTRGATSGPHTTGPSEGL